MPRQLRVDNGPKLVSAKLVAWCEANNVVLHHIQPGKPTQNAYIERFNHLFRAEVLNARLFHSLSEVRDHVHHWMLAYNEEHPNDADRHLPPTIFRQQQPNLKNHTLLAQNSSYKPSR